MNFHHRQYDPQIGRFLSVDPLAVATVRMSSYAGMNNNTAGMVDPLGLTAIDMTSSRNIFFEEGEEWRLAGRRYRGPSAEREDEIDESTGTGLLSLIVSQQLYWQFLQLRATGSWMFATIGFAAGTGGSFDGDGDGIGGKGGKKTPMGPFTNDEVLKDIKSEWQANGGTCPDCLDPSTVGKNFFGMSYPGPNNPMSMNQRDYNYSYVPRSLVEYPAIGHDRRYDRLKITGGSGLLTDPRAIGADWRFVGESFKLAANAWISPTERLQAAILGIGMGIMALPKTIGTLWSPLGGGFGGINSWYNYSNRGVNNVPDVHKH